MKNAMPEFSPSSAYKEISNFLKREIGERTAIIGISGGIDSAVVASLLVSSLGRERVTAIFMPDSRTTASDSADVSSLGNTLSIDIRKVDITPVVGSFSSLLSVSDPRLLGNIKSRTRMIILYYFANLNNGMVIGTTNRSEYLTGYFTKFGDGACDLEPIMHLYKHEVRSLASFLGVPESIIKKNPSAGLWESQTDESEMGFTYDHLDAFLERYEKNSNSARPLNEEEMRMLDLITASSHKRKPPRSLLDSEIE
jgi:NAD+ synthase